MIFYICIGIIIALAVVILGLIIYIVSLTRKRKKEINQNKK